MTRQERNKSWIENLNSKGISSVELDIINNKIKLKIHNQELYTKFREQMEDLISSLSKLSNHSFDVKFNINLIGLLVNEISELDKSSNFGLNIFRTLNFEENSAEVELQVGIIDFNVTEIEGYTLDDEDTYWIKSN